METALSRKAQLIRPRLGLHFPKNIRLKLPQKKNLAFWGLLVVVLALVSYQGISKDIVGRSRTGTEFYATLTKSGFSPGETIIHTGDKVIFTTNLDKPFWPASDPHPSHSIYPSFDPSRPIDPTERWEFTFDRPGRYSYHDHLDALKTGIVVVLDQSGKVSGSACQNASTAEQADLTSAKYQCWLDLMKKSIDQDGIEGALQLLAEIYDQDPTFPGSPCHDMAHQIGTQAYRLYSNHQSFTVSKETSYCGYGFFHGFMDAVIVAGETTKKGGDFCRTISQGVPAKPTGENPAINQTSIITNCFHGIGHGIVERHDKKLTVFDQTQIDFGLGICQGVAQTRDELVNCSDGVFSSIAGQTIQINPGETPPTVDMIQVCSKQLPSFQEGCYRGVGSVQLYGSRDFESAASLVHEIANPASAEEYINQISFALGVRETKGSVEATRLKTVAKSCRDVTPKFESICFKSALRALVYFGPPNEPYSLGLKFCQLLKSSEQESCFRQLLKGLGYLYSKADWQNLCARIDSKYRVWCPSQ